MNVEAFSKGFSDLFQCQNFKGDINPREKKQHSRGQNFFRMIIIKSLLYFIYKVDLDTFTKIQCRPKFLKTLGSIINDQKSAPYLTTIEHNNNKNGLSQLNFERLFIVIFVIVKAHVDTIGKYVEDFTGSFLRK